MSAMLERCIRAAVVALYPEEAAQIQEANGGLLLVPEPIYEQAKRVALVVVDQLRRPDAEMVAAGAEKMPYEYSVTFDQAGECHTREKSRSDCVSAAEPFKAMIEWVIR